MPPTSPLRTPLLPLLLSGVITLSPGTVGAAPSEEYFYQEMPLVLTATRLEQPLLETPASVTVIDQRLIRASGALNIPDVLRLVPGMQVAYVTGQRMSVTYHGGADEFARDMQVLVDGRSVYDPGFGGVAWSDLPLELSDVYRIEVIRGPDAAAYGSNAFAGTINIITEHPTGQQGNFLKATIGEGDRRQLFARHAGGADGFSYRLSANYQEDSGFDSRPDDGLLRSLSFRGDYQGNARDRFLIEAGYSSNRIGEGFYDDPFQPPRDADHVNHFQQLRWTHTADENNEFSLQFYHNYQRIDDHLEVEVPPLPPLAYGLGFTTHRYDIEAQYTSQLGPSLRLVGGAGVRRDSIQSIWVLNREEWIERDQARLFANLEWRQRSNLQWNLGGMFEKFEGKRGLFSPRLAVNYQFATGQGLRLIASRAYRMPTLWEDNAEFVAFLAADMTPVDYLYKTLEELDPEEMTSYEVGYLGDFPRWGTRLDLRLFHERIRNTISDMHIGTIAGPWPIPGGEGAGSYMNGGHLTIDGLELDLTYEPTPAALVKLGYSLADASGEQLKDIPGDGRVIMRSLDQAVPRHTLSLLGSYRFRGGLELSSAYYYMSEMTWGGEGTEVPVYQRLDLRLGQRFRLSDSDLDVALIFQNLGGDTIDFMNSPEINQINIWTQRLYLQAQLQFH